MSRQNFFRVIFIILSLIFLRGESPAQERLFGEDKGPIVITSSTLSADTFKALFEGSVVARTDDIIMHSDRMLVFYSSDGKVDKIEADGNVRLIRGQKVVTSNKAVFIAGEEKIVLTGEPKAVEGENVVTGSKIIYMIKENRYLIEDSRVILRQKE
ncbi:MAG: hypothetical protein HY805_00920 [Nitrospirae bacterium]|nr:hypothetical protein [Nitrospirota bacterium]